MMNSKFVTGTLKTAVGLLLMGGIWLLPLTTVAETIPTPRGTAQQLEGVVARNWSEWPWAVGGQTTDLGSDSEVELVVDLVYQITNHSGLELEIQTPSDDWVNLNLGDGSSRGFFRAAIVRF